MVLKSKLQAKETVTNICEEWHTIIVEQSRNYTPEGRGKLRYYLKMLREACCLDSFWDCVHVQPLYMRATSSIKSVESCFQRLENERLSIEEQEILEGDNLSFQSMLKELCDTHRDVLVRICTASGKNGWTLHSLIAFFRREDPLDPAGKPQKKRSPLTSRLPNESHSSVVAQRIQDHFEKIDRLITLRSPDAAFIYGDQHDLKSLKKNSSEKFLETAMEVIQPAFVSLLDNQFCSCIEKFTAEIPQVVEKHFDCLFQTPISFSVLVSSNPSPVCFSESVLKEVTQLFDIFRMYDNELYSEKCGIVNDLLLHMNRLASERKATEAGKHVTVMLDKFSEQIMTTMIDLASDIETGCLELNDTLLKMFQLYTEAWAIFDKEDATPEIIHMKKVLVEKQISTFAALKEAAKRFKIIPVRVTSCGSQENFTLEICIANADVGYIKQQISQKWQIPEDQQILVCCGEVLEDDVELWNTQVYIQQESLWMIWRNVWCDRHLYERGAKRKILFSWAPSGTVEEVVSQAVALDSAMSGMDIKRCISLFSTFCRLVQLHNFKKWTWNPSIADKSALNSSKGALENVVGLSNFPQVKWYEPHGCALLVSNSVADRLFLQVIPPDGWNFEIHHQGCCHQYSSRPGVHDTKVIFVGSIETHSLDAYLRRADALLSRAEHDRSQQNKGHQKTPDMIVAVLVEAVGTIDLELKDLENVRQMKPRGGFTDVGLEVDGQARNNIWPLFQVVVYTLLSDSARPGLFTSAMAHLHLWLAELVSATTSTAGATTDRVNRVMYMISNAVETYVLENEGEALAFEARCAAVRYELHRALQAKVQQACNSRMLHPEGASNLRKSDFNTTDLKLNLPKGAAPNIGVTSIAERSNKATSNLLFLPAPLKPTSSFSDALKWLKHDLLVPPTIGLTWCSIGETRPTKGRLLTNEELTNALQSQIQFTEEEWAAFKIVDLRATDFIQSGSSYFKPVGPVRLTRMALQLVITSVEQLFFTSTDSLTKKHVPVLKSHDDIRAMVSVLERYRIIISQYEISQEQMKVEIISRELLVVWAAFCFIHQAASSQHDLLKNFAVPLEASDLQHLVLSERRAVDAVRAVASYLRANSEAGGTIFSTKSCDATFTFASQFAQKSREMTATWQKDNTASHERKENRWLVVKKKQKRVEELRTTLQKLEKDQLQLKLDIVKPSIYKQIKHFFMMVSTSDLNSKLEKVSSEIEATLASIKQEEEPPPSILQPLPADREKAMAIIFVLQMPYLFQELSRLSFMAQQMLLPPENSVRLASVEGNGPSIQLSLSQDQPQTMWPDYYRNQNGIGSVVSTAVLFASRSKNPQGRSGPDSVMRYGSSSDGVWHPDHITPAMWWNGGNFELDRRGGYFSPFFAVDFRAKMQYFTEALPSPAQAMQWAMSMCISETRGNIAVAAQHVRPKWLSKSEYLTFGAVRAYPHQQDRKICAALRDRSLPLQEGAVRKLIQQSLFQIGELSTGHDPKFIWKTDRQLGEFWSIFGKELKDFADKLLPKRRDHLKFPVLANMAAYAGQWDPTCRSVAEECSSIALSWAQDVLDDIEGKVPETLDDQNMLALQRVQCCTFYMYAILCYSGSAKLSSHDAQQLCALSLLTENSRMFVAETKHDTTVQDLYVVTQEILAARMNELVDCVEKDQEILTMAVHRKCYRIFHEISDGKM